MASDVSGAGGPRVAHLQSISIPRLLFALLKRRFTGTLALAQHAPSVGERTIWMRGGMPVFTDWDSPTDVLGQILLEQRLLTPDDLNRALQAMAAGGGLLGEILVNEGMLSELKVSEGLRDQCARKLLQIFELREGEVFVTTTDHDRGLGGDGLAQVNVLALILDGVGHYYNYDRVCAEMGEEVHGPLASTAAFAKYRSHFKFRPDDEKALQALTRGSKLESLTRVPGLTRERAAQLVFALWACQMLHVGLAAKEHKPGAAAAQPKPPPPKQTTAAKPPARKPAPAKPPAPKSAPAKKPAAPKPTPPPAKAKPGPNPAQPAAAGAEVSIDPEVFEGELAAVEERIAEEAHAFALLDVPLESDKRSVRRAFSDISRRFHPDLLQAHGLNHLRERVEAVFTALSEAHLELSDNEKREELRELIESGNYEAVRDSKGSVNATAIARAVFESEIIAKDADKLLKAGRFDRALVEYNKAAELNPDEPDLRAALAWCKFQVSVQNTSEAKIALAELDRVITEQPNVARAHYFRGLILLREGHEDSAYAALTKAHEADPRLIDAQRQARAIKIRRNPKPAKEDKGLFGIKGLFGKK